MRCTGKFLLAAAGLSVAGVAAGSWEPAMAACHRFSVSAAPAEVGEGATVTVTVERDAGVAPSSVDVSAVAGSAAPGEDFPAFSETADFPGGSTSQSFPLAIIDDGGDEANETFALHLSNPQGCAVNPNLQVGPDFTVTIVDNDEAAPTTAPPTTAAPTTAAPTTSSTTSTTVATTSSSSSSTSTSTGESSTTTDVADDDAGDEEAAPIADEDGDDDGGGATALFLLFAILVVGSAIGYLLWRRSTNAPPPPPLGG